MCVHVYTYICECTYICIHVSIYIYTHIYFHVYTFFGPLGTKSTPKKTEFVVIGCIPRNCRMITRGGPLT